MSPALPSPTDGAAPGHDPGPGLRPRIWGRRQTGALSDAQHELLASLLPQLRVPLEPGRSLDPLPLFQPPVQAVWLEIGFGGGEHLAAQAAAHPLIGCIGVEPFVTGVVKLLAACRDQHLLNVRVLDGDARLLLAALPEASIARGFILFPDPWPKLRHHKRRIVDAWSLGQLARVLTDGAELRLATDDPGYAAWMVEHAAARADFTPLREPARPADWPVTRYEAKALAAGRQPTLLRYIRTSRG